MTTDVLIQVTELQKHFKGAQQSQDDKIRALDGVSAQIHRGEVVVVIGPSGSGKSTFLRCLNLLELPTGGQILFDGADITDKNCNIKWRKILEGAKSNNFSALAVNSDGDIYGTCVTMSSDGDFLGIKFKTIQASNTVLVKLNKKGDLEWAEYLQGSGDSEYNSVAATDDGGCIVGGTYSIYKRADGIYSMSFGKHDGYVIRYNAKGQVCWARVIGGEKNDSVTAVIPIEGGYAVVGQTESVSDNFQGYKSGGAADGYIIFLNEKGETTTTIRLDGAMDDSVMDIAELSDGSLAIAGWTRSDDLAFRGSNAKKQYMGYVSRYTTTVK